MAAVSGATRELKHLVRQVRDFGGQATGQLSKALAQEARRQVLIGFRRSVDPEDRAWPALKSRAGQPLRRTGRLQNSFTATPRGYASFVVGTNARYAATHQYGATIRPKRAPYLVFEVQRADSMQRATARMKARAASRAVR